MDLALISGGTVRCRTDQVERTMMLIQLQTISSVERIFGPRMNPLGSVVGKEQFGRKAIIVATSVDSPSQVKYIQRTE